MPEKFSTTALLVLVIQYACGTEAFTEADIALAESIRMEQDPEYVSSYNRWRSSSDKMADMIHDSDMDLTAAQYRTLYTPSRERNKRSTNDTKWATPWINATVPYAFRASDFSESEQADIRIAMDTIERWSCVIFRENNADDKHSILFQNGIGTRCSSAVGMLGRGRQEINLGSFGCRLISTYIHELLHALGFVHEHQLPTRTGFLKQYLVNSDPGNQHNFQPYSAEAMADYRQEYDLGSIMHYTSRAFSMTGEKTMSTKQGFQDEYLGMKYYNQLSFGDVKSINMLYNCAVNCPPDPSCGARGGILLKNCSCLTAEEYDDKTCTDTKDEFYCEHLLRRGECFKNREEAGVECPKTCGYCSVFKTGQPARKEDKQCDDYYHNQEKCAEWEAAGACEFDDRRPSYSKWMGLFCRKTCGKCSDAQDVCANYLLNEYICFWYSPKLCNDESFLEMRRSCPSVCGICGQRREGSCENRKSDAECSARADAGGCEEDSIEMFQDCPKTCNRCGFNNGQCDNFHEEQECLHLAATNHCFGGANRVFMERRCAKACNTCRRASRVRCEDIDSRCSSMARLDMCNEPLQKDFMRRLCTKSCGFCRD